MEIKLVNTIHPDPFQSNYDYKKYSVESAEGKFLTHIFENNGDFINLKKSHFYETPEAAAREAVPRRYQKENISVVERPAK